MQTSRTQQAGRPSLAEAVASPRRHWLVPIVLLLAGGTTLTGERHLITPDLAAGEVPFAQGETVRFSVHWKPLFLLPAFQAGEVRLRVSPGSDTRQDGWRVEGWVRSAGRLADMFNLTVEDYFESITEASSFRSSRLTYRRRHNQRKQDTVIRIDHTRGHLSLEKTDVTVSPPQVLENRDSSDVPPALTDILSVFYAARLHRLQPGTRYTIDLLDERGRIRPVEIRIEARQRLTTPLGKFDTVRVTTQGGFFRDAKADGAFRVWFQDDASQLPIRFEADVKLGRVYGHLVGYELPHLTRSVVTPRRKKKN